MPHVIISNASKMMFSSTLTHFVTEVFFLKALVKKVKNDGNFHLHQGGNPPGKKNFNAFLHHLIPIQK